MLDIKLLSDGEMRESSGRQHFSLENFEKNKNLEDFF